MIKTLRKSGIAFLIEVAKAQKGPFSESFTKDWYHFYQDLKEGYYGKSDYYK